MDIPSGMSVVDIVALLFILIGAIQGFFRGLSGEIARLIGIILAFVAGLTLYGPVGEWVSSNTKLGGQGAHALAFITTILLSIIIMVLLRSIIKRMVKVVFAEGFDKGAGVVAGMLRMSIIVCIIFLCMNLIPHEYLNRVFGEESAIGRVVVKYVPTVRETLENANIPLPANKGTEQDDNQKEDKE
jgi:uncharacterized membrane protein required for colicin V production